MHLSHVGQNAIVVSTRKIFDREHPQRPDTQGKLIHCHRQFLNAPHVQGGYIGGRLVSMMLALIYDASLTT